tara:strand:- start:7757 stop:7960 length:204 start_codon:yes stop_codon:yes gene_type:complete
MNLKNLELGTNLKIKNNLVYCNGGPVPVQSFLYLVKLQNKVAIYNDDGTIKLQDLQVETSQPEAVAA